MPTALLPAPGASRALVTGCSTGFGRVTALTLARNGFDVVATMRTPTAGLDEEAAGLPLRVEALDVNDPAAVAAVVGAAGPIDVLVNNAGTELRGPVDLSSDAEARAQFETNVFGLLNVTRAVTPGMKAQGSGVIVNVGSIAGRIARPFTGLYAASKHAVEAISEALHFELGLFGIRVHVVEPGQFATALSANAIDAAAFADDVGPYRRVADELHDKIRGLVPGGEPADPQDVADAILAAATDPDTPLRVPVGADADLILAARDGHTFEEYELTMRTFLDYWEGYRGAR